jgi:hypothetical protein
MIDLLCAETPPAATMLGVPVGCGEGDTKFLPAECVLFAAKLANGIITEDKDSTPRNASMDLLGASWRAKTRYSAHGSH